MLSAADSAIAECTHKTQCCSASVMMTSYNMQEMIIRAEREIATNKNRAQQWGPRSKNLTYFLHGETDSY